LEAHQVLRQDAIGADGFACFGLSNLSAVRPELKEVLSSATAAVKTAPKEEAAAVASEVKALNKVQAQLATLCVK